MRRTKRLAIVGTRTYTDYAVIERLAREHFPNTDTIISGGASGVDSLAEQYARLNRLAFEMHVADWQQHGRAAGPIRNRRIVEDCDAMLAVWDGKSRGTLDAMNKCRAAHKVCIVYNYTTGHYMMRT